MFSTGELVEAYFRNWAAHNEGDDFWAFEEVSDLNRTNPSKLWEITLLLIASAPSERALAYVAAGPVEDLLRDHGDAFLEVVREEAKKNTRFLYTLAGVWLDEEDDPFFSALKQLKREYNLDDVNPLNNLPWNDDNPKPG